MSLTIQQIILDAKRLAGRLKERETEADALLTETQTAYRQIHTMKQVIGTASNFLFELVLEKPASIQPLHVGIGIVLVTTSAQVHML